MESIYTTSVQNVPEDYNAPTQAYKKHVWIAVAGILAFFAFYLFMSFWFLSSAYRLLMDAFGGGNSSLVSVGVGVGSLFLGIFMIKAFFFVQTKYDVQDHQVKPEDEPVLFDYLHKLADEIGAPRPSKVYLSNRVNASVFYDLSFLNLFFPSKKNLEIGLGLINVLNLGEFKAVLAHEYGHFAQKSMLVGRWVYIANQIANTIITKRDALDSFLSGLSRFDFRIAWIGWILSIIVWSIRSLVELIFRVVVLSQRALSREMEFQADLVAVSVTGSDALIHALHKLQAADAALSEAMGALEQQLNKGKAVEDLYAIQSNAIVKTAYVLNDEEYGKSPKVPENNPAAHRVFSDKIAQPPKMWLTHPPDQEREENAKQRYIAGEIDGRSAWDLFNNPNQLRLQMTKELIATAKVETEVMPNSEALDIHNKQYEKSYFNPDFRGVYLNRNLCQEYDSSESVYLPDMTISDATNLIPQLYPTSLVEEIEDFTTLQEEMFQLEAIQDKRATATSENGIWHRGTQIRRRELPKIIRGIKSEVDIARAKVTDHDRQVRTVHLRLAENIGLGWSDYLKGLLSVIHFSEHNIANILDAQRSLGHVLNVVMADNQVTSSEMQKLTRECNEVHFAINSVANSEQNIVIDDLLKKELELDEGQRVFENFEFPSANNENINSWISNIDSWINSYVGSLSRLRSEALELLLRSEEKVLKMHQSQMDKVQSPSPSSINISYKLLKPGDERELKLKLSIWDKFISADNIVAAATKFVVAASIVGGTIYYTGHTGVSDLSIYNGLGQAVMVDLDGDKVRVPKHSSLNTELSNSGDFEITTTTLNGDKIETFKPELGSTSSHYVYNVAKASAMVEYTVHYGINLDGNQTLLGNKRWLKSKADYILKEAPESVTTSSNSTSKDVLAALSDMNPGNIISAMPENANAQDMIKSHVLWDPSDAPNTFQWINYAQGLEEGKALLQKRLASHPNEINTLRALMDLGDETLKNEICEKYNGLSTANPSDANAYYIATRCLTDNAVQKKKYIDGATKFPEHGWMNYAASYNHAMDNNWQQAYNSLQASYKGEVGLRPVISLNTARIARLIERKGEKLSNKNRLESQFLEYYESLERGTDNDPYIKVYYLILKGKLQEALEMANKTPELKPNIIAVCGASDGATKEMIDKALEQDVESLNKLGVFSAVGLRLRKNMDISSFTETLESIQGDEEYDIMNFIKHIRARNFTAAQKELSQAAFTSQAELYSLAYIVHGDKIPSDWIVKAKALLFASEKPFIK